MTPSEFVELVGPHLPIGPYTRISPVIDEDSVFVWTGSEIDGDCRELPVPCAARLIVTAIIEDFGEEDCGVHLFPFGDGKKWKCNIYSGDGETDFEADGDTPLRAALSARSRALAAARGAG